MATVATMPKKKEVHDGAMVKAHVTMSEQLKDALTVLADLEGMTLSALLTDLGRKELDRRGYKPIIDGEKIAAELERRKKNAKASV